MDGQDDDSGRLFPPVSPADDRALEGPGSWLRARRDGTDGEAAVVLAQVRWLLHDVAEQVRLQAQAEGLSSAGHPLALGAELAAYEAANLMPGQPGDDYGPERLPAGTLDTLTAAETLTRALPIEAFPAGMSALVIRICDLIGEATALLGGDGTRPSGGSRDAG